MFSSLRFRLWISYALVVAVVLIIAASTILIYLWRNPTIDRQELQRLRLVSSFIMQRTQIFNLPRLDIAEGRLEETADRLDNATGVRVAIYDANGRLLIDSRSGSSAPLPALSTLREGNTNTRTIFRDINRQQWLFALTPMQGGNFLLVATERRRLPALGALRDEFLGPFTQGAVLALVFALFLAVWIAQWVASPLKGMTDAARQVAAGQYRQISVKGPGEVKSLAHAFNEMVARVQSSQRSQRDFIANVSHDLKTPLTSIQGFAQAILDGTADDPVSLGKSAQVIYDEAGRMNRMVMDLLELARLDSGIVGFEKAPVRIEDLLQDIIDNFAFQAGKKEIQLSQNSTGNLPTINADADRLAQVFSNLVDNAVKHTPPQGKVALFARQIEDFLEVLVADNGPGIPTSELERIFERFYQTDKARPGGERRGVGLGLAIAREIVLAHGGRISAHNHGDLDLDIGLENVFDQPGRGSVFVVKLPLAQPDEPTYARQRTRPV